MKFTVSSSKLLNSLLSINRVISTKNTLEILNSFLFRLESSTLTITASDRETTLVTHVEVDEAVGNGEIAVVAKFLLDTLREFPDQPITFDINDENLAMVIVSSNGSYNFIGQNGKEYPELPQLTDDTRAFAMSADTLLSGINKTLFCTSDDELRPVMTGLFFDLKEDCVTMVATDAHKLVRYKNMTVQMDEPASFILPKKPATMLKNILPKEQGDVAVKFDAKNACFTFSNYTMICRLVEGRFPNYNAVIPTENPHKVIVDRQTLLNSLKRVSVFSNQGSNLVKLAFSNNEIHISAQDIDFSISAEERIACQADGLELNIGFKATFLVEILSNYTSTEVVIELSDPSRSGLVLPFENEENEDVLMLLMPMLLND